MMNKKKVIAVVAAVSAFLVSFVPLAAKLVTSLIETWKLKGAI